MRALLVMMMLCVSALGSRVTSAQERMTLGPYAEGGEELATWIAERVTHARSGTRDIVRLPLVFKSSGWGCECPEHFAGVAPTSHGGGDTWLRVENESGSRFPAVPSYRDDGAEILEGMVMRVDGYFSGDVEHVNMGGTGYDLSVFVVTTIHQRMRTPDNARVALLSSSAVPVCPRIVQDDSPLNVRERPRGRATVVGTIPNGTRIRPVRWQGHRWIRITAPITGWVWVDNTRRACGG